MNAFTNPRLVCNWARSYPFLGQSEIITNVKVGDPFYSTFDLVHDLT